MPQNWDEKRHADSGGDHCPECGAQVAGGRGGCQALFDEIAYAMGTEPRIAAVHRLALDTYCMQHVESYCESAKSYAAHLIGLWYGIHHPRDPVPYTPIARILNQSTTLVNPPVLSNRGSITFPEIMRSYHQDGDVDALVTRIHDWSIIVWQAYESQHALVESWLR
ncbi:MAG: DUF5946 family protein [Chloroflexota bacterium]